MVLVGFWDFQNPNFNDIEIFKSLTLITYKKQINRERGRAVEEQRKSRKQWEEGEKNHTDYQKK